VGTRCVAFSTKRDLGFFHGPWIIATRTYPGAPIDKSLDGRLAPLVSPDERGLPCNEAQDNRKNYPNG
jgi:hypothetical protein